MSSKHGPRKGSQVTFNANKQVRQQDYGLVLVEEDDGGIFVEEILPKGVFALKYLPCMVGDEILYLNDRRCPEDFVGGLPEINYFLETTLEIQFVVMRNTDERPPQPPPYVSPRDKKKTKAGLNIKPGSLMQLHGILKKPELNSKVVEVLGKNVIESKDQRWDVMVLQTQTKIAVTSDKLKLLEVEKDYKIEGGDYLLLQNLRTKPELNGETVKVLEYESNKKRWKVQVVDDTTGKPKSEYAVLSVTPDKLVTEVEFWKNSWARSGWEVS